MTTGSICKEFAVKPPHGGEDAGCGRDRLRGTEVVERGDGRKRYWRLESRPVAPLVCFSAQEGADLTWAADAIRRNGLLFRAEPLDALVDKLTALSHPRSGTEPSGLACARRRKCRFGDSSIPGR